MAITNGRNTKALHPDLNAYPRAFHWGAADLTAIEADLLAENIRYGTTVFGVLGTMVLWVYDLKPPELQELTLTPPAIAMAAVGGIDLTSPHNLPLGLSLALPTIAPATGLSSAIALGGGVAHKQTGPVDTDQTAETNSAAANDMDLLPAAGLAVGDGFYYGSAAKYDWIAILQGIAGEGEWTTGWKYWNGAWVTLPTFNDELVTANLKTTGIKRAQFVRPGDWVTTTVALLDLYWIKFELATYNSMTTQPKGTQAWIGVW